MEDSVTPRFRYAEGRINSPVLKTRTRLPGAGRQLTSIAFPAQTSPPSQSAAMRTTSTRWKGAAQAALDETTGEAELPSNSRKAINKRALAGYIKMTERIRPGRAR